MTDSPLSQLKLMGEALGGIDWVQGAGGNVSIKTDDGELWVKASGTKLSKVAQKDCFSRVPLTVALRAIDGDVDAENELFTRIPRPSLETYFHALPGTIVAHTHALGVLLHACSQVSLIDGLEGIVHEIPYIRPGRGIALALRESWVTEHEEQIFLLGSHGIVVITSSADRAISLTRKVDAHIRTQFGEVPLFGPLTRAYLESPSFDVEKGRARLLPRRRAMVVPSRYLFPDAAVYGTTVNIEHLANPQRLAGRLLADLGRSAVLVDLEGNRVAVARQSWQLDDICEIVAAHDWLENVLSDRGIARYLPLEEPSQIVSMPSEQYRIRLTASQDNRC